MALNRVGSSFLSSKQDAILSKVLKAGEYVPESKFITSGAKDLFESINSKRQTKFFDAIKSSIRKNWSDFKRRGKTKKSNVTQSRPQGKINGVEYENGKITPINAANPVKKSKKTSGLMKKKPKTTNPFKNGIKRAAANVRNAAAKFISKEIGGYAPLLFTKEGISATHRYLDTVVRTTILRKAAAVKSSAIRRVVETKVDYKNCARQLSEAINSYCKAVKNGDKVDIMLAKSRLIDAKASFEIAKKYHRLAEETCNSLAA